MTLLDVVPVALLGAVLGLDVVSFPQAMFSRPLVAATLGGALAGSASHGLVAGVILEMLAMETLPVGASRYPEWATASIVGGALYAQAAALPPGASPAAALLLATLAALATAWAGGWSMFALRRLNGRWTAQLRPQLDAGIAPAVVGLQLRGMVADLCRGALLTSAALLVTWPIMRFGLAHWSLPEGLPRQLVGALAVTVAGGAAWKLAHGAHGAKWTFLAGAAVGMAVLWWR